MKTTNIDSVEKILTNLINGLDPRTGDCLNAKSPLSEDSVKQALKSVLDAVRSYRSEQVRKLSLPANTGKPWTEEEDKRLAIDFDLGGSIDRLAINFQRTKGAIRARLIKLGHIEDYEMYGKSL